MSPSATVTRGDDVTAPEPENVASNGHCYDVTVQGGGEPPNEWTGLLAFEPSPDKDHGDDELEDPEQPEAWDGTPGLRLEVTDLATGRYQVTGGAEPHVVEVGAGTGAVCDCRDFAYRGRVRDCKHITAVRRAQAGA